MQVLPGRAQVLIASVENGAMHYEDEGMRWSVILASRPSPH